MFFCRLAASTRLSAWLLFDWWDWLDLHGPCSVLPGEIPALWCRGQIPQFLWESFRVISPLAEISISTYTLAPNILVRRRSMPSTPRSRDDGGLHVSDGFLVAGFVYHFIHGISEDVDCGLSYTDTNSHADNGIQNGCPQPGAKYADECAYRGERIGSVMPGLCHKCP